MHHDFVGEETGCRGRRDTLDAFRGMLLSDFVQTEVSNWLLLHARVSAEPTKHFQLAMGGGAKRLGVGVQTWGKIIFLGFLTIGGHSHGLHCHGEMRTAFQKDCYIY
jgi:hypothetical protein